MNSDRRGSLIIAVTLIVLGVAFLMLNFAGISIGRAWPVLILLASLAFYIPPLLYPGMRTGLAALFIPGSIIAAVGAILLYDTMTGDWASWAYTWLLIPAGVGLGMLLASIYGHWGSVVMWVGAGLLIGNVVIFGLVVIAFGSAILKLAAAVLVILIGAGMLLNALIKPRA